jgi:hypothetical protein
MTIKTFRAFLAVCSELCDEADRTTEFLSKACGEAQAELSVLKEAHDDRSAVVSHLETTVAQQHALIIGLKSTVATKEALIARYGDEAIERKAAECGVATTFLPKRPRKRRTA